MSSIGRFQLVAGASLAFALTFLFRFLTVTFTNDHFVHLSRAQQVVLGEVPIRDFFDPGLTMQYYASAAALLWSGHNLLGEAILTSAFIGAGVGLTFVAAARLSRSLWLAAAAAGVSALSMPRLYNYPKAFFYVLAIVVAWRYAHRARTSGLFVLALVTAAAFLFRHDHGLYIGLALVVLLTILHWPQPARIASSLTRYAGFTLLLLSPFLVFVQSTIGLASHASPSMGSMGSTLRFNWLPVSVDVAPLVTVPPPSRPRVNVRWAAGIGDNVRRDLERRYELLRPQHLGDSTWSYVPVHLAGAHVGRLVADPAVADTHGIDRRASVVEGRSRIDALQRRFPILRLQVAPGIFTPANALAWWYYLTFLLPLVGLVLLAGLLRQGVLERADAAAIGMAVVLCLIIVQTLVRNSPDSRLPDVANATAVVGAWVAAWCVRFGRQGKPAVRRAATMAVAVVLAVTVWSVGTYAEVLTSVEASGVLSGPSGVWRRLGVVTERLRARPIDIWSREAPGLGGLMRYVFECTAPADRLFMAGFAPQVFFYTERGFAGGRVFLLHVWNSSPEEQRLTIARLERQRVPIVLENSESDYQAYLPLVAEYLHRRYREVPLQGLREYRVLVDPQLAPIRTYEPIGAPCYR